MGITSVLVFVFRYLRTSFKLALCGDYPECQLLLVFALCMLLVYLNLSFHFYTEKEDPLKQRETQTAGINEEIADLLIEEDIEIPAAFRKEYNFLRENAKSLTTLFENYIQKRVSHDTLLKQFQASQENTFQQMKARCNSEHELMVGQEFKATGARGAAENEPKPLKKIITNKSDSPRAAGDTHQKRTVTFKLPE